jgi:hypothetical protein
MAFVVGLWREIQYPAINALAANRLMAMESKRMNSGIE